MDCKKILEMEHKDANGDAIYFAISHMDGGKTLRKLVQSMLTNIRERELDVLNPQPVGYYAAFRGVKLAAAINRQRTLPAKKQ